MNSQHAEAILASLQTVESLRLRRRDDLSLDRRVHAVKRFQHARFERSYADLLAASEYRDAARYFLDELYGPHDFSDRDAQFARIVPALVRLFPEDIVGTVRILAQLHALSERLDLAMADRLPDRPWMLSDYAQAWRQTGEGESRRQQIDWMLQIGRSLLRYTRNPLLRHSLRMMRGPARAAGLFTLQQFLERGFETFRALRRPDAFLEVITVRERQIVDWLFDSHPQTAPPCGLAEDFRPLDGP